MPRAQTTPSTHTNGRRALKEAAPLPNIGDQSNVRALRYLTYVLGRSPHNAPSACRRGLALIAGLEWGLIGAPGQGLTGSSDICSVRSRPEVSESLVRHFVLRQGRRCELEFQAESLRLSCGVGRGRRLRTDELRD